MTIPAVFANQQGFSSHSSRALQNRHGL